MNYTIKNPVDMGMYVQTSNVKTIAQVKEAICGPATRKELKK